MSHESEAQRLAQALANQLHAITISSNTGIFGASATDTALLNLRKNAAELVRSVQIAVKSEQLAHLTALEATLQSAQLLGLLSDNELHTYLQLVDKLYDVIDKEP